jgi:hypothetical protein
LTPNFCGVCRGGSRHCGGAPERLVEPQKMDTEVDGL